MDKPSLERGLQMSAWSPYRLLF